MHVHTYVRICYLLNHCFHISVVTTVSFENRTYSVDEDAGAVQPVLVLSSTLSVNVTLQILNIDGIATGRYKIIM